MMNRREEVRKLLRLSPEEVRGRAGKHLIVCENLDELHKLFARHIADEILKHNKLGKPIKLILPVGPIGQYPYFINIVKKEEISLEKCWIFFMDEYCDEDGSAVATSHPLSFRKIAAEHFIEPLRIFSDINTNQIHFPKEDNLDELSAIIEDLAGIDTCFGGIGIHGHIAFNEPEENVNTLGYRKVKLNNYTRTINAVRAQVGGNLECFPLNAYTIGMKQILNSNKIRLYCRNGTPYDWANTILRIALFARPGNDYPVTYIRSRKNRDYIIITDKDTLQAPKNII
ncbi:MAG: hypothetical protein GF364_04560 [Candidatus Lokiarchaeota archaeon]|nr:hypothetical protein [Candidatus Lokiarchaeota archaeon]